MKKLLIRNATLDGEHKDLLIVDGLFAEIASAVEAPPEAQILDAEGAFAVPPFWNCHTHAPMNPLRGYADDLELFDWLSNHIWPAEAKLTPADIRRGTEAAIHEMLATGTVFFNDMYWHEDEVLEAVLKSGIRACIGPCVIDGADGKAKRQCLDEIALVKERISALSADARRRIRFAYAPHSVYTCSEETLQMMAGMAACDESSFIHIHASETAREVAECKAKYGKSPIAHIDGCGLLTPRTVLAHCVHLSEEDMELIAARGATISSQPCSNFKLASGIFDYALAVDKHGCRFTIGTDGAASNNSLSMFGEMKLAALAAKAASGHPTCGAASDILRAATRTGAQTFGFDGGRIAVGALGDVLLLKRDAPQMSPCHNLVSNVVYSADASCIAAVVCDGDIVARP